MPAAFVHPVPQQVSIRAIVTTKSAMAQVATVNYINIYFMSSKPCSRTNTIRHGLAIVSYILLHVTCLPPASKERSRKEYLESDVA